MSEISVLYRTGQRKRVYYLIVIWQIEIVIYDYIGIIVQYINNDNFLVIYIPDNAARSLYNTGFVANANLSCICPTEGQNGQQDYMKWKYMFPSRPILFFNIS